MSVLDWINTGSVWSKERLLLARDFYAPLAASLSGAHAFARWTAEASMQTEIVVARRLGGLLDGDLDALEAEFTRCPERPPARWQRLMVGIGAALALLGGFGLAATEVQGSASPTALFVSIACMLIGIVVTAASTLASVATMQLDLSHGRIGLLVGQLDEQHPWIYNTLDLLCHPSAESYRQQVISERGHLRGLDFVTMQAIVSANQALTCTRSTRSVVEQLRQVPTTGPSRHETVFRLPFGADHRRRSTDTKEVAGQVAAFESYRRR